VNPEFTEKTDARGRLVVCTYAGETGAARVDSKGLDDAKARAEAQARKKAEERGAA
jgi:hypothetical protein